MSITTKAQAIAAVKGRRSQLLADLRDKLEAEIADWDGKSEIFFYPHNMPEWRWELKNVLDILIAEIQSEDNGWTVDYSVDGCLTVK